MVPVVRIINQRFGAASPLLLGEIFLISCSPLKAIEKPAHYLRPFANKLPTCPLLRLVLVLINFGIINGPLPRSPKKAPIEAKKGRHVTNANCFEEDNL